MDARTLMSGLNSEDDFKSIMKGMFRGRKARKAYAIYSAAQYRGVYPTAELRRDTHEDLGYSIMAFSTSGPLDMATRDTLAAHAERFPLGTIRLESWSYSSLEPWGWHPRGNYKPADHTIEALAEPYPGVLVFVAVAMNTKMSWPLVVHANADGRDYIYPVPDKALR